MIKKYSPYRILNPCEGNVVPLLPNQDFILYLSGSETEIDYCSDFFELKSREIMDGRVSYHFSQKYDLSSWSFFSKIFLGEVLACYSNRIGSLCVYLNNSENIMTLINPNNSSIKVNTDSIIEIVVYDNNNINWKSSFVSASFGKIYEQFGYKKLYPNTESLSIHRSSLLNFTGPEHHFWFRCSVSDFPNGSHYVGKIILSGEQEIRMVNVNISSKKKTKMFVSQNRNIALKINFGMLKKDIYFEKRVDSDLDDDCDAYIMNMNFED